MKPWILLALFVSLGILGLTSLSSGSLANDEGERVPRALYVDERPSIPVFPEGEWLWARSPEALGWSSDKLAKAQDFAEQIGSAAVMIIDDGVVVDAWGDISRNYACHSMRKSLLSALYGIYAAEGAVNLSATLADLGIDDSVPLTDIEKTATVIDLLRARSGIYIPAAGESADMVAMRPERGSHAPGTFWYYNNWDFNALGTIFDQETGEPSIYNAFQTRIAAPIGMQDFRPNELGYSYEDYSTHPYYGFNMSTRDLARFGLLFLQGGQWGTQQVVPNDWVKESTASYSERGPGRGYGYMWWTGTGSGLFPNVTVLSHSYYASGFGGHRVVILPYRSLVIVHRVDTTGSEETVPENEFGALLWLILDASGETNIGTPPFMDQASGIRLNSEALLNAISGNTLHMTDGSPVSAAVTQDRVLHMMVNGVVVMTGSWYVVHDMLYADVPGTDISGHYSAFLDEETISLYEPNGMLSVRFVIEQGLPEGL